MRQIQWEQGSNLRPLYCEAWIGPLRCLNLCPDFLFLSFSIDRSCFSFSALKKLFRKKLPHSARRTPSRKWISQCLNDCRTMTAESFPKSQSKGQMWWTQEINAKAVLSLNLFNRQFFCSQRNYDGRVRDRNSFFLLADTLHFKIVVLIGMSFPVACLSPKPLSNHCHFKNILT